MNWTSSVTNSDNYINKTVYNSVATQGEGIDLRTEMNWLLYGKNTFPIRKPKGHWVIYRRYDLSSKSSNYSVRTHEGVGGPAYNYSDSLLRTRRVPTMKAGIPQDVTKAGIDIGDKYVYYFEYTVKPKIGDHIIELDLDDHTNTPNINTTIYEERFQIKKVHAYRLENGNVQYYIVSCDYDMEGY